MITVITTFSLPEPMSRETARQIFLSTAPAYKDVKGLNRKTYLRSLDGRMAGGVYFWNSNAEAEALYTEAWRSFVKEKYGAEPTVTYFESLVVVDNVVRQILTD